MAIGDTVQAGLGRMDFSAFKTAGAAQAQANQAFGQALEKAAIGFFQGQEKKKKNQEMVQGLTLLFPDAPPELVKSMAKNPEVTQAKLNLDKFNQQKKVQDLQMKQIENVMANTESDRSRAEQNRKETTDFLNFLGQPTYEVDSDGIPSPFPSPSPAEQSLMTKQAKAFMQRAIEQNQPIDQALRMAGQIDKQFLQDQPKAPTINEQIALEKRAEEVEDKTQQKESEEQQRQSLLAETNDILGIIESGKDVTGQVEGLDFVRALKKSVGYGKEDEKLRRKLERYANKFTLENVSKLKGPLSEKELAFIQQSSPKITDEPEVWVDFLTGLKDQLNTEGAGQIPQANPSAPASQSLLDEIERKKQLRSKRAGL